MIAPRDIENTLDRAAYERGFRHAMAHDVTPDSGVTKSTAERAAYMRGYHDGRQQK